MHATRGFQIRNGGSDSAARPFDNTHLQQPRQRAPNENHGPWTWGVGTHVNDRDAHVNSMGIHVIDIATHVNDTGALFNDKRCDVVWCGDMEVDCTVNTPFQEIKKQFLAWNP